MSQPKHCVYGIADRPLQNVKPSALTEARFREALNA